MASSLPDLPRWQRLAAQAHFKLSAFTLLLKLPQWKLRREFRHYHLSSPEKWLKEQRLLAAEQLLLSGNMVKEASAELHYSDIAIFCREFKQRHAMTPTEYVISVNSKCSPQSINSSPQSIHLNCQQERFH